MPSTYCLRGNPLTAQQVPEQPFRMQRDIVYATRGGIPLTLDMYQRNDEQKKEPVIFWIPREPKDAPAEKLRSPDFFGGTVDRNATFPTPVAMYRGYHYTVVSLEYSSIANKDEDISRAIDFLAARADVYNVDMQNVGLLNATEDGYRAEILKLTDTEYSGQKKYILPLANDPDFVKLHALENVEKIVGFFDRGLHGGPYTSDAHPFTTRDPDVTWADPIDIAPDGVSYRQYAIPSSGTKEKGSYLVYLPPSYGTTDKRYPVIYYLHGGTGNQREGRWFSRAMDYAMKSGTMKEAILILPQALPIGWYCNANTGASGVESGPIDDVLIKDLIPHVDETYRTIPNAKNRGLEGWSMGGYGALRLAFKYPELFGYASSLAGAVIDWEDEHLVQYLLNTFGPNDSDRIASSMSYFKSVHPGTIAEENAKKIAGSVSVRLIVGNDDWLYNNGGKPITELFSERLTKLGISNSCTVLKGVGHMLPDAFAEGIVPYPLDFWQNAF